MLKNLFVTLCLSFSLSLSAEIINLNDFRDIDNGFDDATDKTVLMHLAVSNGCEFLYSKPPIYDKSLWYIDNIKSKENRFKKYCWYLKAAEVNGEVNIDPLVANAWIDQHIDKIKYLASADSVVDRAKKELFKEKLFYVQNCLMIREYANSGHSTAFKFLSSETYNNKCS